MLSGRYQLIDVLGSGDTGEVWRGRDRISERPVAVKMLHPQLASDPLVVDRLLRAKAVLAGLWHPGIARLLDVVFEDGRLGLVTELVPGVDLRRRLPVSPPQALRICASLASALATAHRMGVVHGDIKPSNVVIPDHGGEAAVLTDFSVGLFTRAGHMRASRYHPSDEIAGAVPGPSGDIYALGMLLQDMVAHPDGELPSIAISALVAECLHPDPAARPDAAHLADRLASLPADPPPSFRDSAPPPVRQPERRRPRKLRLWAAIGLTALILVAAVVFLTRQGSAPEAGTPSHTANGRKPPAVPTPAATFTQAGGASFVNFWFDTVNYATSTGDSSALAVVVNPDCTGCRPALDAITAGYANGGSLSGGSYLVREVRTSALWTKERPVYDVTVDRAPRSQLDHSGETVQTTPGAPFANCTLILEWVDGKWRVLEIPTSDCIA